MSDTPRDPLSQPDAVEQIAPIEGAEPTEDPQRSSEDGTVEDAQIDADPDLQRDTEEQQNPAAQPGAEPASDLQPETQGEDPVDADLGESGQGDLAPEDS